ncbi:AAA family ATPase [Fibrella aquatilis]|uniref:MoxR family ATPase n=1 Tax=Fibrella aquatilis TaxID=2817059 RepID=A0A939K1R4_9BACT|nr:MoxR family ATPase [Fibrella aquatilis]MBO0932530.1 MoxR family ATPase [Fibrella aquatilis]
MPAPLLLQRIAVNNDPGQYQMSSALQRAVELAIALNKPLLVGGEPGTGKTQLAHAVARRLHEQTQADAAPFLERALQFDTKSSSAASDLFYTYDAVGHFRDKLGQGADQFIELKALGAAFALSQGLAAEGGTLPEPLAERVAAKYTYGQRTGQPLSSVVLIDEVDKAPREFPNDLLNELESFSYEIRELNHRLHKGPDARIVIILTSNFDKNLPPAFLRRCVYYHIPFPETADLLTITQHRLSVAESPKLLGAIKVFEQLYSQNKTVRTPSTGELLDWLGYLTQTGLFEQLQTIPPEKNDPLYETYQLVTNSLVLKTNQ